MRSTVPLKLAVPLKLGRNFVDSRLLRKRSNPLPLQLRGQLSPWLSEPPRKRHRNHEKSYQLICLNRGCFIDFWMFLRANLATKCYAEIPVQARKITYIPLQVMLIFWISLFRDSRLASFFCVSFASVRFVLRPFKGIS